MQFHLKHNNSLHQCIHTHTTINTHSQTHIMHHQSPVSSLCLPHHPIRPPSSYCPPLFPRTLPHVRLHEGSNYRNITWLSWAMFVSLYFLARGQPTNFSVSRHYDHALVSTCCLHGLYYSPPWLLSSLAIACDRFYHTTCTCVSVFQDVLKSMLSYIYPTHLHVPLYVNHEKLLAHTSLIHFLGRQSWGPYPIFIHL